MSISGILQSMLPTIVPLFAGYAVARWAGGGPQALRGILRYAILPALLFLVLVAGVRQELLLKLLVIGIAMGAAGYLLVQFLPKVLGGQHIDASAAIPNIACFTLPFLALSWETKQFGIRAAAILFVAVAVTLMVAERRGKAGQALLKEPWAYAAAAALIFNLLSLSPSWVAKGVGPLAQAAYPLLLMYLGAALHPVGGADFQDKGVWFSVATRYVAGVGVALLAAAIFKITGDLKEALILVGFAPPATAALALTGGGEGGGSRKVVVVGTLVSLVIPIVWLLMG